MPIITETTKKGENKQCTNFKDNIDHELWYDIPFANMAWWDEKFTSQQ